MPRNKKQLVNVRSIYGQRTRQALVEITIPKDAGTQDDENITLLIPRSDARDLALNILQASEAAFVDAFLIEFMRSDNARFNEQDIQRLIYAFRQFREKYDG